MKQSQIGRGSDFRHLALTGVNPSKKSSGDAPVFLSPNDFLLDNGARLIEKW